MCNYVSMFVKYELYIETNKLYYKIYVIGNNCIYFMIKKHEYLFNSIIVNFN